MQKVLKVVFSFDCENRCEYCAVVQSARHSEKRVLKLEPAVAEGKIREASSRFQITGLEIGAGESFLQPDLFEWLIDFNNRETKVPLFLFASLAGGDIERVFKAFSKSEQRVSVLVSYDGRHSERHRDNWPEIEAAYREAVAFRKQTPLVSFKLTACITPKNIFRLKDNFISVLELDPEVPHFNYRPIKRDYSAEAIDVGCRQYQQFLEYARKRHPHFFGKVGKSKKLFFPLKPDWACHREGVSLLPDGSWTDCYVTYYCSDYPEERQVRDLSDVERTFENYWKPENSGCARCLDYLAFCNQCQAGLFDFRRSTGKDFYEPAFCRFINRLILLYLAHSFLVHPGLQVQISRGAEKILASGRDQGLVVLKDLSRGKEVAVLPGEKISSAVWDFLGL